MSKLVGIVNVTPDSFSDGGEYLEPEAAIAHGERLVGEGADIIDIGAESTRPGAALLSSVEEWLRLSPVLAAFKGAPVSVDTRHGETAARALMVGAQMINDVSGLADPQMRDVLAKSACKVIVMHSLSVPADPAITWAPDADPIAEVLRWKREITAIAESSGIAGSRLIYDPGIGFGKTAEQSLQLINRAAELVNSGGIWIFGHSRKSFLQIVSRETDRDEPTLACSALLIKAGVQYLRVHNIARHHDLRGAL